MKKKSPKKKTKTTSEPQRWFLDCDDDGHTYLIPVEEREAWKEWVDSPYSETKYDWVPSFARRTCDNFADITFTNPIETR